MMTINEHILTILGEEGAEIIQGVAKALRFGPDDGYPGTDRTNAGDIANEVIDLMAVVEMLEERGVIKRTNIRVRMNRKKKKVLDHIKYAQSRGTVGFK